jgi:hypothetical protein
MKERTLIGIIVGLLAFVIALGTGNTDIVFVATAIAVFGVGIAYAEGCGKL